MASRSDRRPLLYDEFAAKAAMELWKQKSRFQVDGFVGGASQYGEDIYDTPEAYFAMLASYFRLDYYSRYSSIDGYLVWKGYEAISDRDKYFANCICNFVVQDFFEKSFVLDVAGFLASLEEFLTKNKYLGSFDFSDILEAMKLFLENDEFLKSRGLFIGRKPLGAKFSASADPKEVGDMFAKLREASGLSKTAVASASGANEKAVRRFEKGEHDASMGTIRKFAESMGYDVKIELVPKGNG